MQGTGKFLRPKALERRRQVQAATNRKKKLTREQLLWNVKSLGADARQRYVSKQATWKEWSTNLGWYREVNSPLSAAQIGAFYFSSRYYDSYTVSKVI